jgi:uracil-DNA glycosylase
VPHSILILDVPKCLRDPAQRDARLSEIRQGHMASLTKLVDEMRAQVQFDIPLFDPLDGGVNAECLFLLEAPGPKAVCTGFVSRNNPDETAKNLMLLSIEAGIDRERTILWNVVPWYIGNGSVIRGATASDVREGSALFVQTARTADRTSDSSPGRPARWASSV